MGWRKEFHNSTQSLKVDQRSQTNQQTNANGTSSNGNSNNRQNAHATQANEDQIRDLPSFGKSTNNRNHNQTSQSTVDLRNSSKGASASQRKGFHNSTQSLYCNGNNAANLQKSNERYRPRRDFRNNNNHQSSLRVIVIELSRSDTEILL